MLTEAEIIGPVDMLLSSSLSGMTGQIVGVDGGWTLW
jgi:enoyl-[acyl-carrier-protein] reductase (NADH)